MTPERWRQITEIFHGAVAIGDDAAREAYLHDACTGDPSLRAEIDSLLAAHVDPTSSIDAPMLEAVLTTSRLALGTTLGPYRVEGLLGAGGMGEIYRAQDTRLGRTVALKILPTHLRSNPQLLARFEREARAIANLNHPCICTLYDVGRHDDIDFLVMELIEGETLGSRLRRGRLSIEEAVRFTREVAEALAAAHAKGIIHRDIKPSNIIVSSDGHVKVVDFGLARGTSLFEGVETTRDEPTEPGVRIGTPRYMSPEQALGQPLDPRTDLFSLGVVLFECLTGDLPFEGATRYQYLQNLLSGPVKSVAALRPDAPDDLQAVVAQCLERDASKRLNSASWLAAELERIGSGGQSPWPWWLSKWGIGGGLLVAVVALVMMWPSPDPPTPPAGTDVAQLRRFTTSAGEESDSHFSPDGLWLSFIKRERGERRLFAQQIDGGEPRAVTLPAGSLQSHVWSSDQRAYACLILEDSGWSVHTVSTFFGSSVPLQRVALPSIWRNAKLLRWIDRTIYLQVAEPGRRSPSLQRLKLDTNDFDQLTGPWTEMRVWGFDVRPDGRQVVWSATPQGAQWDDLWVANLDGTGATPVTRQDEESRKRFPLWNGLGTAVIYQSTRGGQVDLWQLDLKSGQSFSLTSDPGIERPESSSKDGSLSYQLTSQKAALWIWNARESKGHQVSDDGLSDFAPSASRDGRLRVAFQRSLPSPVEGFLQMDSEIFIADVPEPATRLAATRKFATGLAPRLSPDGKLLAYLQRSADATALAQLLITNVETGGIDKLSSRVLLPNGTNFPVEWSEQHVAWASSQDLYFVERADRPGASRLVHYRIGSAPRPLPATETTGRLTEIYPSSDGKTIAYITSRSGKAEEESYQLHAVDTTTGTARLVRDFGPQYLVRFRGWFRDDSRLVIARSVGFNDDQTWNLELLVVSLGGTVQPAGTIEHVTHVSSFVSRHSDLYFTRSVEGIGSLLAYSFTVRKPRQIWENSVLDVTFGSVVPLGTDSVMGIRHEQTKDIHVRDARPRARRSPGTP